MSTPIIRRRKKSIAVDTIQWLGTNEADVQAFTGGASLFYALDDEDRENSDDPEATATVYDRLHSTWVLVYTGQHIVRGVKGEYYPIAEDVLDETYELDDGQAAEPSAEAYDGELAMLRGLVRTLRVVVRHDGDLAEAWRLLVAYTQDDAAAHRQAEEKATPAGAPATPDFFQLLHTYQRGQWQFRCLAVEPITWGNGETRAVGYLTRIDGTGSVTGLDSDDWSHGGWTDGGEGE